MIDALIGEVSPALLADFPELLISAQGPKSNEMLNSVKAQVESESLVHYTLPTKRFPKKNDPIHRIGDARGL